VSDATFLEDIGAGKDVEKVIEVDVSTIR